MNAPMNMIDGRNALRRVPFFIFSSHNRNGGRETPIENKRRGKKMPWRKKRSGAAP